MFGGIEAGGTKFVCAISDEKLNLIKKESFKTTTPVETINQVINFFKKDDINLTSIGIGSFGPIDVDKSSEKYGFITTTPKKAWKNFNFLGEIKKHFPKIPISWTTDVNAAAYGEYKQGLGKGKSSLVYFTIGTGIGGGAIQNGKFIQGFSHPEMGHMIIERNAADDFEGNCQFHRCCLEGMAAGPTIEKRFGVTGDNLPNDHPFWKIQADYIAQCAYNTTLMFSPEIIIFGGGVMHRKHLISNIHDMFSERINEYITYPDLEKYIVQPKLGDNAGIIGCLSMAIDYVNGELQ